LSQAVIRRCDAPTCRAEIPATAKAYEFDAALVLRNGTARRASMRRELCSQACLLGSLSELVKAAEAAPETPDCHALGSSS
jgi:hypothetical protein